MSTDYGFDTDFAGPGQWASEYRRVGLQVIPCVTPSEDPKNWKRPKLSEWRTLQEDLVPDATFERWYGEDGEHYRRYNMGVLTGRASGNLLVVDLDIHKNPEAGQWWRHMMALENAGLELETVEQRTGGGGLQKFFRAPSGRHCPTNRTDIGVDIRGQGGFAVLPPSRHESGKDYEWLPGRAPWETGILEAPEWLLNHVDDLVEAHGGHKGASARRVPGESGPEPELDAWGKVYEGRERVMRDHVWHAQLEWCRETALCPIAPPAHEWPARAATSYLNYEQKVTVQKPLPNESKRDGLKREGRGELAYWQKWRLTMRKWGTPEFMEAAGQPNPHEKEEKFGSTDWDFGPGHEQQAPPHVNPASGQTIKLLLTSAQFLAGFIPPIYLVDGIIQRGFLYSLTARTNHGKTAIAMYVLQCIARGVPMHGHKVWKGTVLLLAGENPQDIRARFLVLAEAYGFDPEALDVRFVSGVINLPARMDEIRAEAADIPDLVLVIVDTAAAYFPGDQTNDNAQQGAYARLLRELTALPGNPAVLVNCHPIKNAAQDNLLPMGGSAFVNEVDGNLTLWTEERRVRLHWQGKFRGPEFEPLLFELETATSPRAVDGEGRLMPSVVAKPMSEAAAEAGAAAQQSDEDRVMWILGRSPGASFAQIAERCNFVVDGRPQKARVQRIIVRLKDDKLVEKHRSGKYRLTKKGRKEIGMEENDD